MSRKITASLFISLDGVVEAPDQWHFPYFDDAMGAAVGAGLDSTEILLFGRRTYDSFAGAWPEREAAGGEDTGFAKQLGDMRKIVFSRSRRDLGDRFVNRAALGYSPTDETKRPRTR